MHQPSYTNIVHDGAISRMEPKDGPIHNGDSAVGKATTYVLLQLQHVQGFDRLTP